MLTFSERDLIERASEVWTLGDSGGESILKSLKGHIRGVGPAKIEVDCNFIQGNSGGPIVTPEAKVVGIASYMTINPSIWAKGTEQEIRRIAWIPGRNFHWVPTTSQNLNLERTLVHECAITSDLLLVISHLNMSPQGFIAPEDFPDEAVNIIAVANKHPLCLGIDETGRSIKKQAALPRTGRSTAHDEYVKFLTICADYQRSQLQKADQGIKSSFWRNQFNLKIRDYTEILINFQAQVKEYERTGGHPGSLSGQ